MAFDNCTELERWQEWSDFASAMNRDSGRVHFTFFVSGVNFIANANRAVYEGPRQRRGAASINFGGTPDDVRRRVAYINARRRNGHEIASHAVGHFNGSGWSAAEWAQEFRAFNDVAAKVGSNNGFGGAVKLAFPLTDVRGFRAPYLSR
jgi:peptidoglycan/xylan/chitin deacetylase (PgdA/CDA1 family)